MTNKQKQAITVLNGLLNNGKMNENEYFLLLDFVVEQPAQQVWNPAPWTITNTKPLDPYYEPYGKFGPVTCSAATTESKCETPLDDAATRTKRLIMENKSPI